MNQFQFAEDAISPNQISEELGYVRYDQTFPVPKVENVYKAWKPVDHGHPLRDATLYYAPPTLERVRLGSESSRGPEHGRSGDSVFQYDLNIQIKRNQCTL